MNTLTSRLALVDREKEYNIERLTCVVIIHDGGTFNYFVPLMHDNRGAAHLPQAVLSMLLKQSGYVAGKRYYVR